MILSALEYLACPWCAGAPLRVVAGATSGGALRTGELGCAVCGRVSPVRAGVWDAMGARHPQRSIAQVANATTLETLVYERWWRPRSGSLLAGRRFPLSEELAEMTTALQPIAGRVAVDIGCSEGLYARSLARSGALVIAVDHSVAFVCRVARRAEREGLDIVAVRGLAQHLPIRDACLDGVAVGGTLNEIGDRSRALAEAYRVCRPGGQMFSMSALRAETRLGRMVQAALRATGIGFPTQSQTTELISAAGFEIQSNRRDHVIARVSAVRRSR